MFQENVSVQFQTKWLVVIKSLLLQDQVDAGHQAGVNSFESLLASSHHHRHSGQSTSGRWLESGLTNSRDSKSCLMIGRTGTRGHVTWVPTV